MDPERNLDIKRSQIRLPEHFRAVFLTVLSKIIYKYVINAKVNADHIESSIIDRALGGFDKQTGANMFMIRDRIAKYQLL
jgi:hypothetical protein